MFRSIAKNILTILLVLVSTAISARSTHADSKSDLSISIEASGKTAKPYRDKKFEFKITVGNSGAPTTGPVTATVKYPTKTLRFLTIINNTDWSCIEDQSSNDTASVKCTTSKKIESTVEFTLNFLVTGTKNKYISLNADISSTEDTVTAANKSKKSASFQRVPINDTVVVTGHVFNDVNSNKTYDPNNGDYGLPNISVKITESNGQTSTEITDKDGRYKLRVIPGNFTASVYRVDYHIPPGSIVTTGSFEQTLDTNLGTTIPSVGLWQDSSNKDFVDTKATATGSVKGVNDIPTILKLIVFNDANNNGIKDQGESGASGIPFSFADADGNRKLIKSGKDGEIQTVILPGKVTITVPESIDSTKFTNTLNTFVYEAKDKITNELSPIGVSQEPNVASVEAIIWVRKSY